MKEIVIDDLLKKVKTYNGNNEDIDVIKKAYEYASSLHKNQYRQSGEPYISHPLTVAYILAEMKADTDTICAGLLHDTLEDTKATKNEIENLFNTEVSKLVDGVTKISKLNFSTKVEQNMANTRKIITGLTEDVRIIIIKLADRLHNMRTLEYKNQFKQKENSMETMDIFVPMAYYIGSYKIKAELEDLSLQYLYPDKYKKIEEMKEKIESENQSVLYEMLNTIKKILEEETIPHDLRVRTKNIYGIYKRLEEGNKINDIHDLLSLKIIVDSIKNCYLTLGLVHSKYNPINDKFKDYICNPKTNMYQSLHTTVFGPKEKIVQTQIRTFNMDKIATHGLTAYWDIKKGNARENMQKDLREKYQFFKNLTEIDRVFGDNQDFVRQVKEEVFADKIYVYTTTGEVIELPRGSTIIDFAYKMSNDIGDSLVGALVNDINVDLGYVLKNKDRVRIITSAFSFGPGKDWFNKTITTGAKRRIKEFNRK